MNLALRKLVYYKNADGEDENIFVSLFFICAMCSIILFDKIYAMKYWLIKIGILLAMALVYVSYLWAPINGGGL